MKKQRRNTFLWSILLAAVLLTAYSVLTSATDFGWVKLGNNSVYIDNQTVDLNGTVRVNGSAVCTIASGCGATGTGTVTQVNTGNGLTGGPITTTGTVSVSAPTTSGGQALGWSGSAFTTVSTGGGGSGSGNITSNNGTVGYWARFTNSTNVEAASLTCASGYAINTLSNNSVCVQFVQPTRSVSTTSPLQGGGTLAADLTLSILQSNSGQNGYLSSTDWTTFNNKGISNITSIGITVTNTTAVKIQNSPLTGNGNININFQNASASQDGLLRSVDFSLFQNYYSNITGLQTSNTSTNTRIDQLNTSKAATGNCGSLFVQNITSTTVQCAAASGSGDGNNYTTSVTVTGTTTKNITIFEVTGNVSTTWTDQDTQYSFSSNDSGIITYNTSNNFIPNINYTYLNTIYLRSFSETDPIATPRINTLNTSLIQQIGRIDTLNTTAQQINTTLYSILLGTWMNSNGSILSNYLTVDVNTTKLVASIGNWSLDKSSYSTTSQANNLYAPLVVTYNNITALQISNTSIYNRDDAITVNLTTINNTLMTIEAGQYTNITTLQQTKGISNVSLSGTAGQPLFYNTSNTTITRLINSTDLNTTNTPTGGQCLTYGSNGQGTWAACATITGGTGNVTSSNGSANYIPVFSNSTNLVTGSLRDNGSFVNVSGNYVVGADNYAFLAFLNNSNSTNVTTVNWNNGSLQKVNLNASSVTINFVAPQSGVNRLTLLLQQDSTGSRVPTFNGSTIKWAGAAAPTFTTTANRADIVTCLYDGVNSTGNYYCVASLNFG